MFDQPSETSPEFCLAAPIVVGKDSPGDPMPFVVEGLLLGGTVSLLYGDSNSGKTAVAVLLGSTICRGGTLGKRRTSEGATLHVAMEAPRSVYNRALPYLTEDGIAHPYLVLPQRMDVTRSDVVKALVQFIVEFEEATGVAINLVTIDTLVLAIGDGDENSSRDMTSLVNAVQRIAGETGAHVMLIHHAGKGSAQLARGSSALRAGVDTELLLAVEEIDGEHYSILKTMKQRDLPKSPRMAFRIDSAVIGHNDHGDPMTTAVAKLANIPAGAQTTGGRQSGGKGDVDRVVAVELAVARLIADHPDRAASGFKAPEVADFVDGSAFKTCGSRPSLLSAVGRVLSTRAKAANSRITDVSGAYTIAPHGETECELAEPREKEKP